MGKRPVERQEVHPLFIITKEQIGEYVSVLRETLEEW